MMKFLGIILLLISCTALRAEVPALEPAQPSAAGVFNVHDSSGAIFDTEDTFRPAPSPVVSSGLAQKESACGIRKNTKNSKSGDVFAGGASYYAKCFKCHADTDRKVAANPERAAWEVETRRMPKPDDGSLSAAERTDIANFIRSEFGSTLK